MGLTKYKLGELLHLEDVRNSSRKYTLKDVKGISIQKRFIETKADMQGVSLTPYKLVKPDFFAYVTVTSRNGEKITLAHNDTENTYIVSSSYIVFSIERRDLLDSDYLFMFFNRPEFDRYSRFNSWGSARETFDWSTMCDIDIVLPPLEIQKKYVAIYKAMLANQQSYERGLEDLKLAVDALLDKFKESEPKIAMKELLDEVDVRNTQDEHDSAYGVNITKQFMPSKASSSDLHNYKVVQKNQFVFSGMQTGRDECIRLALLTDKKSVIVSPAYIVFKTKSDEIMPEYIQMWFSRSETDRLGWFLSDSSIRTNLDLESFYNIKIPVPALTQQEAIVGIYKAYQKRREICERLKIQIKDICPILIKGAVEEGERG